MSYAEINRELNILYFEMKNANYSDDQIRKKIAPILKKIPGERKKYFIIFGSFLVLFLMIFFLTYWNTFYWHISALIRIFLIQILPYFDWRYLKNEPCLLPKFSVFQEKNPVYYYQQGPTFNCDTCENLQEIEVFEFIDEDVLIQKYIETDTPVILTRGLDHWRHDVQDFFNQISSENDFWFSQPCKLSTSIHSGSSTTVGNLFHKAELFESFFMHFQNCEKPAKRIFRNFTYRPDFLPEVYSPTMYNWMIWSKNYNNTTYKKIDLTEKITVFGQIHGRTLIRLLPRKNCEFECPVLELDLNIGEYVIFTPLWSLEYHGFGTGENLAAILELRD